MSSDDILLSKRALKALSFQQRVKLCDTAGVHFACLEAVLQQPGTQQSSLTADAFRQLVNLAAVRHEPAADILEAGEAMRGRPKNGQAKATATHCRNGHAWTEETTAQTKQGRKCRTCNTEAMRRHRGTDTPPPPGPPASLDKLRQWADLCRCEYRVGQTHVRVGAKELAELLQWAHDSLTPA